MFACHRVCVLAWFASVVGAPVLVTYVLAAAGLLPRTNVLSTKPEMSGTASLSREIEMQTQKKNSKVNLKTKQQPRIIITRTVLTRHDLFRFNIIRSEASQYDKDGVRSQQISVVQMPSPEPKVTKMMVRVPAIEDDI